METCDVLIIGGGPAGSSCAWKLRKAGIDVIVVDKKKFPRDKVCAGWVTPPVLEELKIDAAEYRQQRTLQAITRFITGMIGGPEIETDYRRTVSFGIRRCEFDDYLLRRANVRLRLGTNFQSLRPEGRNWILNDEIRAPIVIGAGGHFCPVARQFAMSNDSNGTMKNEQPTVLAQEIEFEMTDQQQHECSVIPDRPELFFCPDLKGYGWVFRKGNFINIGLGREGDAHLSNSVRDFKQGLATSGKIPRNIANRLNGHAYRLCTVLPVRTLPDGILLIGDAAGMAAPQSGEGIRPAIESGLLAAAAILESAGQPTFRLAANFDQMLRARFDHANPNTLFQLVPASVRSTIASALMRSRWLRRRVLLDRWFLNLDQTSLLV